jgi:hypothetical protein
LNSMCTTDDKKYSESEMVSFCVMVIFIGL